ncbi:transaldolase/EF-hand domain-containing protein [Roseovarius litorisediminis]|uniref:Transaldolase/EF-hand domain-containing protein n=1 Tax=Roseovarius litorisediminis TaxID=1312363 RepID=A0A1Y5RVS4_9RHOB|nr:EF-hand domain-containing protein [Roseovarius litorisediminis]SLN25588.1 transaldolase/EF-hand domain-containing protein [Roseovarius litorisediminis]
MKRQLLVSGVVAAAIAATSTFAIAQQAGQGGMRQGPAFDFDELDADGDGKVTPEEMQARAQERFTAADTDGDGAISTEEMIARMQSRMAERMAARAKMMMEARDANNDGKVTMDEMQPQMMGRMFEMHDSDGDGAISQEEFAAIKKMHHRGKMKDGSGKGMSRMNGHKREGRGYDQHDHYGREHGYHGHHDGHGHHDDHHHHDHHDHHDHHRHH